MHDLLTKTVSWAYGRPVTLQKGYVPFLLFTSVIIYWLHPRPLEVFHEIGEYKYVFGALIINSFALASMVDDMEG